MKLIISIVIGVAVFFGMGNLTHEIFHIKPLTWLVAIAFGILAIVISFKKLGGTSVKETIADGVSYVKTTSEDISSLVDDKDSEFYAIAEQEIKDDVINNGLWSQALVKAKGDENLRKIEYMKVRVKQLKKG
jgi:hypothetical protein